MRALHTVPVALLLLAAVPAVAQDRTNGRYAIAPTADGYLKLDTRTGEVTECRRPTGGGLRCVLVPDERAALQEEIDRLARDNAALKAALTGTGVSPPESRAPDTTAPEIGPPESGAPGAGASPGSPSDREVDRALSIMERFLRRMMSVMREEPGRSEPQP